MKATYTLAPPSSPGEVLQRSAKLLRLADEKRLGLPGRIVFSEFKNEAVALGRYQRRGALPGIEEFMKRGMPILRRETGGVALKFAPGMLHVAVILETPSAWIETPVIKVLNRYVRGILTGLGSIGLDPSYFGKEFISTSHGQVAYITYTVGTHKGVLIECLIALDRTWSLSAHGSAPPENVDHTTGGKAPATIRQTGRDGGTIPQLSRRIAEGFATRYGIEMESSEWRATPLEETTPETRESAEIEPDLRGWSHAGRSVSIGNLEAFVRSRSGIIEEARLFGDFLADPSGIRELETRLRGIKAEIGAVLRVIHDLYAPGQHFIIGAPLDAVAETITAALTPRAPIPS